MILLPKRLIRKRLKTEGIYDLVESLEIYDIVQHDMDGCYRGWYFTALLTEPIQGWTSIHSSNWYEAEAYALKQKLYLVTSNIHQPVNYKREN